MTTIATICARGGSQGLLGKNIRPFAGEPLIVHSIRHALAHPAIDAVFVSTDSPDIAKIARDAGAEVPFLRPAPLATAEAAKLPVIEHLVAALEEGGLAIERIVDLQPTSPLRAAEDIAGCLALLDAETDCAATACLSPANPYYNLVELDAAGRAVLSKANAVPLVARQAAPPVYAITGSVYCWHRATLCKGVLGGRTRLHLVLAGRSVDIDDALDFRFAEMLFCEARR